jgi:tRNA (Thr-GGU) A37 N-methylase
MNDSVVMPIIGYMHSPYREKFGIPRQPNLVQIESYIEMSEPYNDVLAFEELRSLVIYGCCGSSMIIKN